MGRHLFSLLDTFTKIIIYFNNDKVKNLIVKPLFIIPGKHVISDISTGDRSWMNMLREKNINATINENSLLQYEKIRKLYIKNIREAIKK